MPSLKQLAKTQNLAKDKIINWFPGHMYSGMQAMIGKLNTTDAVVEVHDARIPTIGRNKEFSDHLGRIKPRLLVLNKMDLADLSRWDDVKKTLASRGDENILLTDLSGSQFSRNKRGYDTLLQRVIDLIRSSDRHNRSDAVDFKIMIVGIPNVGKSTLINRLRQHHLGRGGTPAAVGPMAGVTKHVDNKIKICARPLVYSLDTPGVLEPGQTKSKRQAMQLALCSNINDAALNPETVASFLLDFLNKDNNHTYLYDFLLDKPAEDIRQLYAAAKNVPEFYEKGNENMVSPRINQTKVCWELIRKFRRGNYGKVMFFD